MRAPCSTTTSPASRPAMINEARHRLGVRHRARDCEGNYLDGAKTYKVTLPPPIPAANFWSFNVYDNQHRSVLETDQKLAGLDSTVAEP